MSKPGRKPKPTMIKMIQGNPGKRPIRKEPEFSGDTNCPSWLGAAAKAEWKRIAPALRRYGLLSPLDRLALAGYCDSVAEWKNACEQIEKNGATVTYQTRTGQYTQQSPFVSIRNRARKSMLQFGVEFGMTPSSRSNVGAVVEDEQEKAHLKFLRLD